MSHARSLADLSAAQVHLLDRLCDGFERSWQDALRHGTERPRLEALLAQVNEEARDLGLRELLKVELGQRRQHGERPAVQDYGDRFPELGQVLSAFLAEQGGDDGNSANPFMVAGGARMDVLSAAEQESIPGYRLMRRLGGGGMGEVFLACQLFSTPADALRSVALKSIRPELLTSPRHRLIMENDIRIAALLDHPHIVRILHVGPAEGQLYYTMPYLKGGSLEDQIGRKPLPSRAAAELLLQVVQAVAYLHSQSSPVPE
jgi:hypothetical protein